MQTIFVVPAQGGWAVRSGAIANDLMFRSGVRAEQAAKRLAAALSRAGEAVSVRVHLRDGALAARYLWPPLPPSRRSGAGPAPEPMLAIA